ncbi:MAG TPA: helix-turn-helix domain-containing protein [Chloroflexi bacterium]|jgi:transposase|nr:helix-turn-helix domain-containing protein [Chloroflexota bacterium]
MARAPIYVRTLTEEEEAALRAGLRSRDAFTLRRCQILLASACGKRASQIASELGCDTDTALNAINAFNRNGVSALTPGSTKPYRIERGFDSAAAEQLRALLHQSPRNFGKATSLWTLELAAEVSFEQGLTAERVSREAVRTALQRLGVSWKRAKQWITSPDPAYVRKKETATA